jgi:hypothetical protein
MPTTETIESLRAEIAALTTERDTLLQKHRAVCKACALLDTDPASTIEAFLAKHSKKSAT